MTEPTYTLEQAKKLLERQKCEQQAGASRYGGSNVHPLGHPLGKVMNGNTGKLLFYRCSRCGAKFVEAEDDCQ